jgi:hypothetical protein
VDLERRAGGGVRGVGSRHLRRRDVTGGVLGPAAQGERGHVDERAREVQRHADVGQGVLERLVLTDHTAELLALLGVADRLLEESLTGAEELRGARQDAGVHGLRDRGLVEHRDLASWGQGEQSACRVHRTQDVAGRAASQNRPVEHEARSGDVGVQCVGREVGERDGALGLSGDEAGEHLVLLGRPERHGEKCDALDPGAGHRVAPECLERDDEVHLAGIETAALLGDEQPGDAELGEAVPQLQPRPGVALGPGPDHTGGVGTGEQVVEDLGEALLLLGEREPHRRGSFGRPRTRSATMLRWISLVPA